MKKTKIIPPVIVLVITACLLTYFLLIRKGVPDGKIITSGHIEVTEVDMSFSLMNALVNLLLGDGHTHLPYPDFLVSHGRLKKEGSFSVQIKDARSHILLFPQRGFHLGF